MNLSQILEVKILATWDADAGVWVATSDDVPGLATEAETQELLLEKLRVMVPELLHENRVIESADGNHVPIDLLVQSRERLSA